MGAGRVLMLVENNSYPKDPRVRKEAQALVNARYSVAVISPAEKGQASHENVEGVSVYRYPAPPPASSFLGYMWEYGYSTAAILVLSVWVLLREGFDVLHAANPPDTLVFVAIAYKYLGKKFIFDVHDLAPEMYYARFPHRKNRWVHRVLIWCERISFRYADQVITVNETYKTVAMRRGGVREDRIAIVRNGPEPAGFASAVPDPALRSRAKILIVYAGMIGVQDGVDALVRIVHHLVADLCRTDLLCVILGDGDALPEAKEQARQLEVTDYILFTGWISDPRRYTSYLASADICVDTSPANAYNDGCTSIKMTEYMAAGKPTITFDLLEHRRAAETSACYVEPGDELEFARAIASLMDDGPRRIVMGSSGRQRIEQRLSWEHSVPLLLAAYQAATGACASASPEPAFRSDPTAF